MNNFFRNFYIRGIGLFLLFGIFNILLVIGLIGIFGFMNMNNDYNNRISFKDIEASINGDESQKQIVRNKLEEQNSFFLLINSNGDVINEEFLPEELNHNYSRVEIASFTRWYLEDYPVNTKILDNGNILVIGFPKFSVVKYSLTTSMQSFFQSIFLVPLILVLDFAFFLFLFWRQQRKAQEEVKPVIEGIEELAQGKKVDLKETGELRNLKAEINKASNLLQEKEKGRADWISGVSHDIRTPLASILTASELIKKTKENQNYISQIQRNVKKIEKLAQNLNLSNKLHHGLAPVNKERLNIAELLRNNIIEFIDENSIDPKLIDLEVCDSIINIDSFLFARLIQNLLDNWYSHNKEGTRLKVICLNKVNVYTMKVQNEVIPREFNDRESKVHLGLGLSLVEQICRLQGWEVEWNEDLIFEVTITIPKDKVDE